LTASIVLHKERERKYTSEDRVQLKKQQLLLLSNIPFAAQKESQLQPTRLNDSPQD
jgi:hypothetical protein